MVAYVTIPTDIDREEYISYCLKTQSLSLETLEGGYYNRVPVSIVNLNLIEFPEKVGQRGSQVICMFTDREQPVVVTVLGKFNTIGDTVEGDMKHSVSDNEVHIETRGSRKTQSYTIVARGDKTPHIVLKVFNNKKLKGKFLLEVDGDIVTVGNNLIDNTAFNSITNTVYSSDKDEDKKTIVEQLKDTITSTAENFSYQEVKEFKINGGKEAMLLGNKMEAFLNTLLDKIGAITVTTALGQMPILNAADILAMKKDINPLLSKIGKLE